MFPVHVIKSVRELQQEAERQRRARRRIALVPTMGALHEGHVSLIEHARERADRVWLSIFVNPTQFNDPKDYETYPQDLERDLEICRRAGVDLVFAPTSAELYPTGLGGPRTWLDVQGLGEPLCGASRPGHFRGVATVVLKLFIAARPHVAVFGEKDFQQLAIIRKMVRDLGFGIEIIAAPTVREADGLAVSSRNVRLGPRARREATALVHALEEAERAVAAGARDRATLLECVTKALESGAPHGRIDYAELRDPDSLELAPLTLEEPTLLALAVEFPPDEDGQGSPVRLIDNRVLYPQPAAKK